jgi:hypothetical protein
MEHSPQAYLDSGVCTIHSNHPKEKQRRKKPADKTGRQKNLPSCVRSRVPGFSLKVANIPVHARSELVVPYWSFSAAKIIFD